MTPPASDRGFALLIVLWAVVLLTLLSTQLVASGRTELQLAANLRGAAVAEAAADGAVHQAIFHVLDPSSSWPADGAEHGLRVPGGTVAVRVEDEGNKINLNTAPRELLSALLRRVGADGRAADSLAAAIVAWRTPSGQGTAGDAAYRAANLGYGPPGTPFRDVTELGAVLGTTPDLLARLLPNLSVLTDTAPDLARAPQPVRDALQDLGASATAVSRPLPLRTVVITARAAGDSGGRFVRRAVVRLGQTEKEPLFQILTWDALPE